MALGVSVLTSGTNGADQSSYAIPSASYVAGRLYLLCVLTYRESAEPSIPVPGSVAGQAWTQDEDVLITTIGTPRQRLTTFSLVASADATTSFSVGYGGTTQGGINFVILEITGSVSVRASALVQSDTQGPSVGTSITETLSAFANAANAAIGFVGINNQAGTTPGSGFTELYDATISGVNAGLQAEWKLNDNTVDASFANTTVSMISYEIRALFTQSLSGSITPTGSLANALTKLLSVAGSITPTGTLATLRQAMLSLGGSITPTGALVTTHIRHLLSALVEGTLSLLGLSEDTKTLNPTSEDSLNLDPLEIGRAHV